MFLTYRLCSHPLELSYATERRGGRRNERKKWAWKASITGDDSWLCVEYWLRHEKKSLAISFVQSPFFYIQHFFLLFVSLIRSSQRRSRRFVVDKKEKKPERSLNARGNTSEHTWINLTTLWAHRIRSGDWCRVDSFRNSLSCSYFAIAAHKSAAE